MNFLMTNRMETVNSKTTAVSIETAVSGNNPIKRHLLSTPAKDLSKAVNRLK